ncbi:FAD-dependent monooxygenase [Couchioplanes caeruleus]|uniref:FAD-binding monooxygenase n=2 Tax=Couchioplanes caeruleus TaxID=56438 RepID=A0A1K0G115_9ACTN|nr:FAD-dependent monooxygenase [Couchioplanes caeruleus]OJF10986.1 FAD-binding monooxygenase [Couchioplanes caeruleus subsp. caeruleus]ROP33538.1 2-polyprenyl-6-methoxyphenol hydroxylase-like FAD-dependent oxidoreductase [Couchioplanes caeruleus]
MTDDSVLVVGGGIAGLALSRALRQRGVPASVAERSATPASGGLAINLPGNAVSALAALGLRDGLESLGRPVRRREYRGARGRLLFAVDEDAFWDSEARPRCVRRVDLLALLDDGPEALASRRSSTVESVRLKQSGAEVAFDDGGTEPHGFVAGADGVHSVVRATVFGGEGVRTAVLSTASWRFMAPNPGIDCWTVWTGPTGVILLIPVDGDEVYGYASATGGGSVGADPGWLHTTFRGFAAPIPEVVDMVLRQPESLYHSPVEEVRISEWSRGRCVLLGDAAHATAPVWAQGAALAMEDAIVLADLLAGGDWDTVGARYEEHRRDRVTHVQAMTDRFSRLAGVPPWIRDLVTPVMGPRSYRATYGPLRRPVSTGG